MCEHCEQDDEPKVLFRATIGGKEIEYSQTMIPADTLVIEPFRIKDIHEMLDRQISSLREAADKEYIRTLKDSINEPIKIYIFSMPIDAYLEISKEIDIFEDKEVSMGEFTRMIVFGEEKTVSLDLEKDHIYDVFGFSGNMFIGGGRFNTGETEIPQEITFEEMRFLAVKNLGVSIDQAKQVTATVVPMTSWGVCGRKIIAGFCLDPVREKDVDDHTIMVTHALEVSYSHDYVKEDFMQFFNK